MLKEAIATGSTVDEAKESAVKELGLGVNNIDEIQFEVIDVPRKKTLGLFGGCPAKVRAFIEIADSDAKNTKGKNKKDKIENKSDSSDDDKIEKKELQPITDPEKQKVADNAVAYLKSIFDNIGVEVEIKTGQTAHGIEIELNGDNLGVIVGRRGETLDAIQYLTVLAANRNHESYQRVTINTGNYREKREKTLRSLAHRMANQALRNGRNVTLEPMNPYERRIIHTAVQDIKGVTSWSVGEEPARKVVIGSKKGGHSRSSRGYNRDAGKKVSDSANVVEREQIKDMDIAPLYGKIK